MEPPESLANEQSAAWTAFEAGLSDADVAEKAGVTSRTVERWKAKWRGEYGDDLFRNEARERRRRQTELATLEAKRAWAQRRTEEANAAGEAAAVARAKILDALERDDPAMVRAATGCYHYLITNAERLAPAGTTATVDEMSVAEKEARLIELVDGVTPMPQRELGAAPPPAAATA